MFVIRCDHKFTFPRPHAGSDAYPDDEKETPAENRQKLKDKKDREKKTKEKEANFQNYKN